MCSINEVEDGLKIADEKRQSTANLDICMKCGEKSVVLVRARDPMCKPCFLHYYSHKFRATLGKSKAIRKGEKVLVAFSAGQSSCSLLRLIKEGLSESAQKKLRFTPEVVYINEGSVLGWNADKVLCINNKVTSFCQKLGFDVSIIDLEKVYAGSQQTDSILSKQRDQQCCSKDPNNSSAIPTLDERNQHNAESGEERLRVSFQNAKSLTAKQDLLHTIRCQLVRDYAKEKQCGKIIVAETSTRLSIKLLLNIAQGRGGSLPYDIGVNDNRDDQTKIVRPMRELTSKEVAFYNRMNEIDPIVNESLDTMEPSSASLRKQTEAFVTNLQAGFSSTVSTIFRTGDKLTVSDDLKRTDVRCIMCQTPIVDDYVPISLPESTKEDSTDASSCCGNGDGSCETNARTTISLTSSDLVQKLCYGCRLTFRDMDDKPDSLPPYAISEFEKSVRRSQMKDSIQQFLL